MSVTHTPNGLQYFSNKSLMPLYLKVFTLIMFIRTHTHVIFSHWLSLLLLSLDNFLEGRWISALICSDGAVWKWVSGGKLDGRTRYFSSNRRSVRHRHRACKTVQKLLLEKSKITWGERGKGLSNSWMRQNFIIHMTVSVAHQLSLLKGNLLKGWEKHLTVMSLDTTECIHL